MRSRACRGAEAGSAPESVTALDHCMLTVARFLRRDWRLLIAVHEYGHYRVAVACGVKVLRFSIGFGKPLLPLAVQGTQSAPSLCSALFPLGGYVKMLDEREGAGGARRAASGLQHPAAACRARDRGGRPGGQPAAGGAAVRRASTGSACRAAGAVLAPPVAGIAGRARPGWRAASGCCGPALDGDELSRRAVVRRSALAADARRA